MDLTKVILSFLAKYFFVLKAASDGWRISYLGGDKFEFCKRKTKGLTHNSYAFLNVYKNKVLYSTYV